MRSRWMRTVTLVGLAAFVVMGGATVALLVLSWVIDAAWVRPAVRITGSVGLGGCLVAWVVGMLWAAAVEDAEKKQSQDP